MLYSDVTDCPGYTDAGGAILMPRFLYDINCCQQPRIKSLAGMILLTPPLRLHQSIKL